MRLQDFQWEIGYSTDECDLVSKFYEPAMSASIYYNRAAGYFSSSSLSLIAQGIQNIYLNNGKIRVIASPVISANDREAIYRGLKKREEIIEYRLIEYLDKNKLSEEENYRLQLLTGMIADGLLEIRIAVKEEEDGSVNLYHEKVGIFIDAYNDFITFIGSPNETWNGWVGNAESFALHKSWDFSSEYAIREYELFQRTWNRERKKITIYTFPESIRKALFDIFPPRTPNDNFKRSNIKKNKYVFHLPEWLNEGEKLFSYQKEAINNWLEAGGRGIFAMATGTGKTITALVAAIQLSRECLCNKVPLLIVIAVPSIDLVKQWEMSTHEFGFIPICCHSGTASSWPIYFKKLIASLQVSGGEVGSVEVIITTADTMASLRFKKIVDNFKGRILFIGDEMHSFGTKRRLDALPNAQYRIGLSATPRRHGDEEGTNELLSYFGNVLQSIDIKKAIQLKALVPYKYEPVIVRLDDNELEKYYALSAKIAALYGYSSGNDDNFFERAGWLLTERARLLGHAKAKLSELESIMNLLVNDYYNLIYVAEGTHPIYNTKQLDEVVSLLGKKYGMQVNTYTSKTSTDDRMKYQRMLRDRDLQALIAMRCLDEGIDIPEAKRGIILASTQNPRQFVQRRGRILRRDKKGTKTHAELYDFLVVPSESPSKGDPVFNLERRLVGRELSRALELASASDNWSNIPPSNLFKIMKDYDLLELIANYSNPSNWEAGGENIYER